MTSGSDGPAQLGVQRLDSVRGVDDFANAFGKREEWNDQVPVAAPALRDRRILLARVLSAKASRAAWPILASAARWHRPERLRDAIDICYPLVFFDLPFGSRSAMRVLCEARRSTRWPRNAERHAAGIHGVDLLVEVRKSGAVASAAALPSQTLAMFSALFVSFV